MILFTLDMLWLSEWNHLLAMHGSLNGNRISQLWELGRRKSDMVIRIFRYFHDLHIQRRYWRHTMFRSYWDSAG